LTFPVITNTLLSYKKTIKKVLHYVFGWRTISM
jgi:hypothetical protein